MNTSVRELKRENYYKIKNHLENDQIIYLTKQEHLTGVLIRQMTHRNRKQYRYSTNINKKNRLLFENFKLGKLYNQVNLIPNTFTEYYFDNANIFINISNSSDDLTIFLSCIEIDENPIISDVSAITPIINTEGGQRKKRRNTYTRSKKRRTVRRQQ